MSFFASASYLGLGFDSKKQTVYHLEYIWTDVNGNLRSKTKIFKKKHKQDEEESKSIFSSINKSYASNSSDKLTLEELPYWNYDGSSTGQAEGHNSEVILKPIKMIPNPFYYRKHFLVLCETYLPNGEPHPTNTRVKASEVFTPENMELDNPTFGLEQEFFVFRVPMGWKGQEETPRQGQYYCGLGGNSTFDLRKLAEEVIDKCLSVELNITGFNFEVAPGQIEFQLCQSGLDACDDFLLMRYIISLVCERYGAYPVWEVKPKPLNTPNWNGSGCHINFSTRAMMDFDEKKKPHQRVVSSWQVINDFLKELEKNHQEHLAVYGKDNDQRLTGINETSSTEKFTYGVADRGASVRIPSTTMVNQKGYIEDRRPGSNIDPYLALTRLYQTYLDARDNSKWYL
jgi:glutamine synthetase